jgi:hypothetical protein
LAFGRYGVSRTVIHRDCDWPASQQSGHFYPIHIIVSLSSNASIHRDNIVAQLSLSIELYLEYHGNGIEPAGFVVSTINAPR